MNEVSAGCILFAIILALMSIPAWITHVIYTILAEQWVLLFVGAFFFPVGVVHGWGIWFGIF